MPTSLPDCEPENRYGRERSARLRTCVRTVERLFGAIAAVVLLPLAFIIALIIKLTSVGPICVRVRRRGVQGGSDSKLLFRSFEVPSGRRLVFTPFGRLLRRSGLDQLPQVIKSCWRGEQIG